MQQPNLFEVPEPPPTPARRRTRKRKPEEPTPIAPLAVTEPVSDDLDVAEDDVLEAPTRRTFSVSDLTQELRDLFEQCYGDIWVTGEISGTRLAPSGHYYFTLKDGAAQLRCACFRNAARLLRFKPQDGVAVLARGRLEIYEARGEYQLIVETLEPQGDGALQVAFDLMRKRLAAEGLFDAARKRPLPRLPLRVGIVTSPTGAVIRDMINVLQRRFPMAHVRLFPTLVQGDGAADGLCRGLAHFSADNWAQVVIVARGGGSLEDLWAFNEETVARAIAACSVPVVSAVGHETDFTIADFVADLRAPTPSAAAELILPHQDDLREQVRAHQRCCFQSVRLLMGDLQRRLQRQGIERAQSTLQRVVNRHGRRLDDLDELLRASLRAALLTRRQSLQSAQSHLQRQDVRLRVAEGRRRWERAEAALAQRIQLKLANAHCHLSPLIKQVEQLSPLTILQRGYALVETPQGEIVKDPVATPPGTELSIRVAHGHLNATVTPPAK